MSEDHAGLKDGDICPTCKQKVMDRVSRWTQLDFEILNSGKKELDELPAELGLGLTPEVMEFICALRMVALKSAGLKVPALAVQKACTVVNTWMRAMDGACYHELGPIQDGKLSVSTRYDYAMGGWIDTIRPFAMRVLAAINAGEVFSCGFCCRIGHSSTGTDRVIYCSDACAAGAHKREIQRLAEPDQSKFTEEELDDLDYFFGAGIATDTNQARAAKEEI